MVEAGAVGRLTVAQLDEGEIHAERGGKDAFYVADGQSKHGRRGGGADAFAMELRRLLHREPGSESAIGRFRLNPNRADGFLKRERPGRGDAVRDQYAGGADCRMTG